MISENDIICLIRIGRENPNIHSNDILYFSNRDYINRIGRSEWKKFSNNLSDDDLIYLFKGLVLVEKKLKWFGGSVAGAIWIYKLIEKRKLDPDFEIADFGLRNCDNPWVPFGNSYYGIRNISEYFYYQEEKERLREIKSKKYEELLTRVKGRKIKRKKAVFELRKLSYEDRRKIQEQLRIKYENHNYLEKLEIIADDDKYPPEYYPKEWAEITTAEIKNLPLDLVRKLYDKLATKARGSWKVLAKELKSMDNS